MRRVIGAMLLACVLCAGALAGCGPSLSPPRHSDAAAARVSRALADKLALAARTHELPTPAPRQRAPGQRTPQQAISTFATIYINWTARSVATQMTQLALASVGQARSELALAAAQTQRDLQLREGGIANSGTVEAVAPLPGVLNQFVVVTREATSATNTTAYQGLAPAWHVTIATVVELAPGRWVISGWQPEN